MSNSLKLISASPERKKILEDLGYSVHVAPSDIDETPSEAESAEKLVRRLSEAKLEPLSSSGESCWAIAADTVVEVSGRIRGKPKDEAEARHYLESLEQSKIKVWTGTAMLPPGGRVRLDVSSAILESKNWISQEIESYLKSGLWRGRAGGFSIFHEPTPVVLIEGRLDVVRGLNGEFVSGVLKGSNES